LEIVDQMTSDREFKFKVISTRTCWVSTSQWCFPGQLSLIWTDMDVIWTLNEYERN